jgi:hypothetical protein
MVRRKHDNYRRTQPPSEPPPASPPPSRQARQEAEHMRHECRRLEGELQLSARQVESLQRAHDEALDRLSAGSRAMLGAANGGAGGARAG